jgi:hypothetical protein
MQIKVQNKFVQGISREGQVILGRTRKNFYANTIKRVVRIAKKEFGSITTLDVKCLPRGRTAR